MRKLRETRETRGTRKQGSRGASGATTNYQLPVPYTPYPFITHHFLCRESRTWRWFFFFG
ncbi:hypothetical protein [Chroococcidiopsis thermalis]|uniref:hypothetical protein n=1 Tax=Chroococcidiopsis thermalis TaxID=54299 RepID=UPI0015F063F4|nr:hypothetical protein [Chroococcidiopsis thermalis]